MADKGVQPDAGEAGSPLSVESTQGQGKGAPGWEQRQATFLLRPTLPITDLTHRGKSDQCHTGIA